MKRFLAIFASFLFLLGIIPAHLFATTVQAEEIEEPKDLYAQSAVLMDAESGRILFEKNGQEIMPMASTTKIMTCILALEEGNLEDAVTVSVNAAAQPKVHLGMREGEQFYLRDLLYSLMLESHNDSAVAIAEHVAGSVENFAGLMNEKAEELGCTDTYFLTPNGLDAEDENGNHSTTAEDLARIMSYCIMESDKKEDFLAITGTANHTFSNLKGSRTYGCTNHNSFLTMMEGAISGKTGFTGKAGYCYVGAVERDGRTFVVSLLACGWPNNKNYKWKDMKKLMEYAISNYQFRNVYEEVDLPHILVKDGISGTGNMFEDAYAKLEVKVEGDKKDVPELQVLLRTDEDVEIRVECEEELNAPLARGECVGKVIYSLESEVIREYPIVITESVQKKDMAWYLRQIARAYFCASSL